ncbi:proteasome inhibitor PI31 subunit isoform X1 [Apis mellifera carnica]|uniref:Proteasome inhibitor PI31 subunit n=1 Tax=Apis mellifera TaxID=7460 RepID=A0A7M7R730_APIME|nr:proteasome inhibitor PI31 subunit isoform X1 [Apis mellifera]KAG9430774.1 proteasome inhibitor PI31 subunit isoform X1 [Apis mellifera carnica]|eukprot:XP_393166.2 proteasome inhibitor PI31 subunit isoform X1 [Apis mellifera]
MVDTNNIFGFELFQEIYNKQITKKEDLLILFIHWYLIKQGFRCIGIGDSKVFEPSEKGSQLLPEGWNMQPSYTLRYINNGKLFIFHGIKSDEDLLVNLLKIHDQKVSTIQFPINQTINDLHGTLEVIIPSYQNIINIIQTDIIDTLIPSNTTENSTQTIYNTPGDDSLRGDPLRVLPQSSFASSQWRPAADPTNIGAADLNPLGRGGGMIFDPFSSQRNPIDPYRPALGVPGRLPSGAVPPFARFDPFGPPDLDRPRPRRDPDNDHLPPPGYNDMFM